MLLPPNWSPYVETFTGTITPKTAMVDISEYALNRYKCPMRWLCAFDVDPGPKCNWDLAKLLLNLGISNSISHTITNVFIHRKKVPCTIDTNTTDHSMKYGTKVFHYFNRSAWQKIITFHTTIIVVNLFDRFILSCPVGQQCLHQKNTSVGKKKDDCIHDRVSEILCEWVRG